MLVAVKNVQHDWCFLIGLLPVKFSLVKCPLVYSLTYDVTPGFKLFTLAVKCILFASQKDNDHGFVCSWKCSKLKT